MEPRRRTVLLGAVGAAVLAATGCATSTPAPAAPASPPPPSSPPPTAPDLAAPAAQVLTRAADVPVLCWHQLRDWRPGDSASARATLICPPAAFRAQLDALHAGGYTTISPDEHLAHLTTGAPLPPKPVLLTFDDSQGSQITTGVPELARRGMRAAFFVMTVPLGKPNWMSRDDVRRLHDAGHTVAAHTYDHHRADRYAGADWDTQLAKPRAAGGDRRGPGPPLRLPLRRLDPGRLRPSRPGGLRHRLPARREAGGARRGRCSPSAGPSSGRRGAGRSSRRPWPAPDSQASALFSPVRTDLQQDEGHAAPRAPIGAHYNRSCSLP